MDRWRRQFRSESTRQTPHRELLAIRIPASVVSQKSAGLAGWFEVGSSGLGHHMETSWKSSEVSEKPLFRKQSAFPFPIGHGFHNRQRAEQKQELASRPHPTYLITLMQMYVPCQPVAPRRLSTAAMCARGQIYHCYKGQLMDMLKKNSMASSAARASGVRESTRQLPTLGSTHHTASQPTSQAGEKLSEREKTKTLARPTHHHGRFRRRLLIDDHQRRVQRFVLNPDRATISSGGRVERGSRVAETGARNGDQAQLEHGPRERTSQ